MFKFANPYYLVLFLPLFIGLILVYRRAVNRGTLFSTASEVGAQLTWRVVLTRIMPLLVFAGTACCIVALARPQNVFSQKRQTTEAVAIQMVLDTSGSMGALDFSESREKLITRLDVIKRTFSEFVGKREHDLIGLVTFAGYASSRAPLTLDHDVLHHALEAVKLPRQRVRGGRIVNQDEFMTAIGDGLATGCARLEDAEVASRVVVLLSDGESNAGIITPDQAIKAAETLGIKVYTIGVGSTGNKPVMTIDNNGKPQYGYQAFRLDEALLTRIAESTGGRYYNVRTPGALEQALAEIDELEKTEIDQTIYSQQDELFFPWLAAGTGLLLLGMVTQSLTLGRLI